MTLHNLLTAFGALIGMLMMVCILLTDETEAPNLHYFYCFLLVICMYIIILLALG